MTESVMFASRENFREKTNKLTDNYSNRTISDYDYTAQCVFS